MKRGSDLGSDHCSGAKRATDHDHRSYSYLSIDTPNGGHRSGLSLHISLLSAFYQLFQSTIKTFSVTPSTVQPVEIIATAKNGITTEAESEELFKNLSAAEKSEQY
jgi:hypothetical protein